MDSLTCDTARRLLDPSLDGELEPTTQLAFDAHLAACAACREARAGRLALIEGVKSQARRHTAPDGLRQRLALQLAAAALPPSIALPSRRHAWLSGGAWASSVAALAASLMLFLATPGQQDNLDRDLLNAHLRSLVPDHLTDVQSTDQHTVKPWFNGRLPLSPPVPNLAGDGFPLVGGRLDYLDQRPAAALVYRHARHIINLFVWPAAGTAAQPPHLDSRNGYNLLQWSKDGMAYAAVSDLNRPELEGFQRLWAQSAADSDAPAPR